MVDTNEIEVHNNVEKSRYETYVEGQAAFADYVIQDETVIFTHTEVPDELSGQGIASKIVRFALDDVQGSGHGVIPLCPFIKSYIERHEEYQPLVLEKKAWRPILNKTDIFE